MWEQPQDSLLPGNCGGGGGRPGKAQPPRALGGHSLPLAYGAVRLLLEGCALTPTREGRPRCALLTGSRLGGSGCPPRGAARCLLRPLPVRRQRWLLQNVPKTRPRRTEAGAHRGRELMGWQEDAGGDPALLVRLAATRPPASPLSPSHPAVPPPLAVGLRGGGGWSWAPGKRLSPGPL